MGQGGNLLYKISNDSLSMSRQRMHYISKVTLSLDLSVSCENGCPRLRNREREREREKGREKEGGGGGG